MGMARTMSMMIIGQQVDAVYHTSIVVYGREYYFGGGICNDLPKQTPYGKPLEEVPLGEREKEINHISSKSRRLRGPRNKSMLIKKD
jgi:hypothetical protein